MCMVDSGVKGPWCVPQEVLKRECDPWVIAIGARSLIVLFLKLLVLSKVCRKTFKVRDLPSD